MTAAAFQATYADWRVIKGRKVVQVCFEIPLEAADTAYQVLGGMPIAAKEVWCGIARIVPEATNRKDGDASERASQHSKHPDTTPRPSVVPAPAAGAEISLDEAIARRAPKSPAQIAGYLCTTVPFQKFLREKFGSWWHSCDGTALDKDQTAAAVVRELCKVNSRADLTEHNIEWNALLLAFRVWENHPELEDA